MQQWRQAADGSEKTSLFASSPVASTRVGAVAAQAVALAEARERTETLTALLALARVLAEARSMCDIARNVAQAAVALVHCDRAVVVVWDPGDNLLVRRGTSGPELRPGPVSAPIPLDTARALARRGQPVVLTADSPRGLRSLRAVVQMSDALLVPMVAGNELLGAVVVPLPAPPPRGAIEEDLLLHEDGREPCTEPGPSDLAIEVGREPCTEPGPSYFADKERERLAGLAGLAATAISNAALLDRIRHEAEHDPLTGLPNLRLVDRLATVGLADAARRRSPVAVLFVDLDRFKAVNDRFGHACGDRLLVEAACRLRAAVRGADTVGRVGGDEFVVVLTQAGHLTGALSVAGRIVRTFATPFVVDGVEITIGASVGVAMSDAQDTTVASLLARADAAMYQAKQAGRSRIGVHGGEVVDPLRP